MMKGKENEGSKGHIEFLRQTALLPFTETGNSDKGLWV